MKSLVALSIACCVVIALLGGVSVSGSPLGVAEWEDDVSANTSTPASPTPDQTTPDVTTPEVTTPEMTTSEAPGSSTPESSGSTPEVMSTAEHSSTPHSSGSTPQTSHGPSVPSSSANPPPTTPAPARGFDVGSFFGGMATCLGVIIIGFVGYKLYSRNKSDGYKTM